MQSGAYQDGAASSALNGTLEQVPDVGGERFRRRIDPNGGYYGHGVGVRRLPNRIGA